MSDAQPTLADTTDDGRAQETPVPWESPVPEAEQRVLNTVAAHLVLDNVGALADLLAQLPPETSLWLDEYVRADPDNRLKQQATAITPRIVGVAERTAGTEEATTRPGLELGAVQVPFDSTPDAQEALAVRRDLLPVDTYARAEERMEAGAVPGALADLSSLLKDIAGLLAHATDWLDRDSRDADALRTEASRIEQSAARISQLATMIREEDCG